MGVCSVEWGCVCCVGMWGEGTLSLGLGKGHWGLTHTPKGDTQIPFRFPVYIVNFKYKCSSLFIITSEDIQVWLVKGLSVSCCVFIFKKGKCCSFGHRE